MTTLEQFSTTAETREFSTYEYLSDKAQRVGTFVLDRFLQRGNHQMAATTKTPLFFHDSHPNDSTNIEMGTE